MKFQNLTLPPFRTAKNKRKGPEITFLPSPRNTCSVTRVVQPSTATMNATFCTSNATDGHTASRISVENSTMRQWNAMSTSTAPKNANRTGPYARLNARNRSDRSACSSRTHSISTADSWAVRAAADGANVTDRFQNAFSAENLDRTRELFTQRRVPSGPGSRSVRLRQKNNRIESKKNLHFPSRFLQTRHCRYTLNLKYVNTFTGMIKNVVP